LSQETVSIHPHPSIIGDQPHFRDVCSRVVAIRSAWIRYYHQGFEPRKKVPLPLCHLAQPRLHIIPSHSVEIRTNRGTAIPWFVNNTLSTHRIPTKPNFGSCTDTECTRTLIHGTHDAESYGHAGSPSQTIVFCAHVDCKQHSSSHTY